MHNGSRVGGTYGIKGREKVVAAFDWGFHAWRAGKGYYIVG